MSAGTQTAEAAMTENSDNTTTISNDKGSVVVETANIENPDEGRNFSTAPTEDGTNTITKTGKVDYKYVTAEGNAVLEENKNQDSGADKTIETKYDVYGKSGEVFKETTGGDAQDSDLDNAKENGKKETIEKDGKTYHLIGEPKVETTGDGGGVYSDTTLGDVTAKLTPEGLSNAEGKITYDTVKAGGKAWIVEQTGKGTYGKYVQADSGAITSDDKLKEAFTAGEAAAKNFTAANVTADGGIKEGDYVFVLEKNTYVTVSNDSPQLTAMIPLSPKDNVADDADDPHGEGTGASLDRTYAMVQKFKAAPDTLEGERNKTVVKGYLAYLQEKGLEDNILNFKRYFVVGLEAKTGVKSAIAVDNGDQVDAKGRPTSDVTVDYSGVSESGTTSIDEGHGDFTLNLSSPDAEVETYSYRDEITPLRAYRLASGTTTITYTYAEEKTREIEKKGSVVVNYQTEDGTELKAPYTDTPETVAEVVTEKYYVNADGQEVIVSSTKAPKNIAYNTKENADEKPEKLTDANGNVYYLKADATKTAVNDQEKDAPAETGTVVEGVTKVTYIYEKAGSVIVNYKTEDGTALTGTVVGDESKTVESGAKDVDNGKPGTAYNTADNGMKPERIKTAEGKVYQLVPESTEGEETGEVVAGETKEVTYVYKEVKGNVVVKYEDTEGNTLADDEQDETDASLNVKYDTADHKKDEITKDGVKYYLTEKALKDDSKPENGDVVEGKTEVTYVYEKAGQVVVHYTDEKGNTIQVDAVDTKDGKPNSDYNTADNNMKPNRITTPEGKVYELIPQSTKGDETGKVKAGETTEVTYVYKEITGNVVVHYVDTEGNTLAADTKDVENGSLSDKYDTTDNKPAKLEKDGQVYYLTAKELKDGSKPENGAVVEGTTEITYVYEKAGNVVVHYVDEAGNILQADAVDTKDGKPGAKYDTSDNDMKPTRITTPEGKVYELVPASTKGNETGDVEAGKTTEVTYVYKEVKGNVVVHYTDEAGNTIAEDVKDTTDGSVSSAYDTTDNKPATITTKDGKLYVLVPTSTKGDENGKVTEGTTEVTYVYKDVKEEASKEIDKVLSEKESKIKENPELTNEEKEKAIEEAKKTAEQAKKALEEAKTPEDVEKSTTKAKEDVEKSPVTPEDKPKAKEEIDKALEDKVKKIDENPNLTPEQKEKAKEEAKKDAEEAKKAIDKAPSKEEVEKAKENGKKEVEKDTPTPDQPSTPSNPSTDNPTNPSEGDKDKPYTPSPEDKAKAKETVEKELEEKIKNIDKDPSLTPEQKEKAKEEAKKEAEKVKKSIDEGKTTEWVDEKGNPIKPVTPGTYPAGSIPNYELVGTVTNPETGKVTHIFKPVTKEEKTTVWVDVNGKPLKPAKPGTEEAGNVPNYKLVGTTVDPTTGNVIHVFTPTPVVNKVTEWVDTEGNVLKPKEEGVKDPGKVPNYELVGTVTNPETGKVTHIFRPTTSDKPSTVWVDVNGKPLKPTAPGKEEAGSVPKYKLVETKINPETGDVIHVFTPVPVVNKVTEWVDTEGNVIRPKEEGSKDPGKVPNYELVGTVKDPETGKVTHIFKPSTKKQVTVWVDINGKPLKPLAEGSNPAGEVPGYELVGTKVDPATGNLLHVFKPKGSATPGTPGTPGENPGTPGTNPGMPGQNPGTPGTNPGMPGQNPGTPGTPANPEKPMDPNAPANPATPTMPSAPVNGEAPQVPAAPSEAKGQAELPNTGTEDHASLAALGLLGVLSGFGLVARKKKED